MVSYSVDNESVKNFMNHLLKGDMFDNFLLRSAEVETFVKISIDGSLNRDYFETEQTLPFCEWKTLKPYFFDIIKGAKKPRYMKLVFSKHPEELSKISSNAAALFINILFENDALTLTTGCGQKTFSLDKSVDSAWDEAVYKFLSEYKIISTLAD